MKKRDFVKNRDFEREFTPLKTYSIDYEFTDIDTIWQEKAYKLQARRWRNLKRQLF